MAYILVKDFPGVPAGTELTVDPKNPGRYNGPNGFWCDASILASSAINFSDAETVWKNKLDEGYLDPDTGIKLKLTDRARSQFLELSAGINDALLLGSADNSTQETIWDFDDKTHTLTILEIRALLLRYRMFYAKLFAQYAP